MTTIRLPQSFKDKIDEWLYVMRWTTSKSREASPVLFVARAVFSVVQGLFVILRCVAIWWGVDWLMVALEDPQQSEQMLTRLALLAGGLLAMEAVGRQIAYWLGSRAAFHLEMLLKREFITKSSELDLAEIEAAGERKLLENRHSLDYTVCGVMDSIYSFIFLGVEAMGLVVLCALIGWPILMAGTALLVVSLVQWLTRPQEDSQDEEFTLKANLEHLLSGQHPAKEIRLFGLIPYFKGMAEEAAERFYSRGLFTIGNAARNLVFYLPFLAIALCFGYWLVEQVMAKEISLGLACMALVVVFIAHQAVSGISRMTWAWERSLEGIQGYQAFLDIQPQIRPEPNLPAVPTDLGAGIVFEDVSLTYPTSDQPAIEGVSLTIRPGERIALVGENGSGKTTFVKLLTRLYDPTAGRIHLGGRDLREYNVETYRQRFGVIFQDYMRYHGTVAENIGYAQYERLDDLDGIAAAAEKAGLREFIETLDDGYQTRIGSWFDRGTDLSGGQWQKIALARAFFRQSDILVLDEPTSVLDARAEYDIFQRFLELTAGKTTILISHRFSTVRMADTIYVFQQGHIAERGSHRELMAQDGLYAELFNMQAEGFLLDSQRAAG
ncbi:MAG: ABC transporter ATP-binding protein [Gemmatimonadetes bacterium]|nr:ABC transporter ATP-binding protein [Gemmatimonadota bacterium]